MPTKTTKPVVAQPLLISAKNAAQLLSISTRKLHDLTAPKGPIPVVRLSENGGLRYSMAALIAWIDSQVQS